MRFVFTALCFAAQVCAQHSSASNFYSGNAELWAVDQADSGPNGGGVLYVTDLNGEITRTLDLNALTAAAGCSQNKRAHMLSPVSEVGGTNSKYIVLSSVGSGNVQVLDTATKAIVGCIDFPNKADGSKASLHQATVSADGSYFVGFDIGPIGRLFKVVMKPLANGNLNLTIVSSLELTDALFPTVAQAKPICGVLNQRTGLYHVTLAGGGMVVFDADSRDEPSQDIAVRHVYSKAEVPGIGCTVDYLADGSMISGGASLTGANTIFHWPVPKSKTDFPAPKKYVMENASDIHGTFTCVTAGGDSFVWVSKRLGGGFSVLSLQTGKISEIPLPLNNGVPAFPDVAAFLHDGKGGGRAFAALRGPKPLTAIVSYQESKRRAGWAVFDVTKDCQRIQDGLVKYVEANPTLIANGAPDIHGVSLVWKSGARPALGPLSTPTAPCPVAAATAIASASSSKCAQGAIDICTRYGLGCSKSAAGEKCVSQTTATAVTFQAPTYNYASTFPAYNSYYGTSAYNFGTVLPTYARGN